MMSPLSQLQSNKLRLKIQKRNELKDIADFEYSSIECHFDYLVFRDSSGKRKDAEWIQITAEDIWKAHQIVSETTPQGDKTPIHILAQSKAARRMLVGSHSDVLWSKSADQQTKLTAKMTNALYRNPLPSVVFPVTINALWTFQSIESVSLPSRKQQDFIESKREFHPVVRLTDDLLQHHEMKNAIVAFIGPTQVLQELSNNYSCNRKEHVDRVDFLFPMPLVDALLCGQKKKDMKKYFEQVVVDHYFFPNVTPGDNTQKSSKETYNQPKIKVKHHVEDLFTAIGKTWKLSDDANEIDKMNCPYSLAHGNLKDILSVQLSAYKSKDKYEIDIPGGKRELGETSWECAVRETWEEIGVDLTTNAALLSELDIDISKENVDWVISQHRETADFSFYIALHKCLWQQIHHHVEETRNVEENGLLNPIHWLKKFFESLKLW